MSVRQHGEAIDYDLMTMTGWTLRDWESGRLDGRTLYRFVRGLGPGSRYFAETHPQDAATIAWLDGTATDAILADLIDVVAQGMRALAYKGTGRTAPAFTPYRRPWADDGRKHFGRDPIPVSEFDDWYYRSG